MSLTFALQNLLIRHEAYVASAEEERRQMAASIDKLELEKKGLEAANSRIIEDNRHLLDDLEELNSSLSNSEARIRSLTSALESTSDELERLNALAARSSQLEAQLLDMEMEQSTLQSQLMSTELDCRSATRRWKSAERTIATLQDHVDRIEQEAREERERHEEVVSQFERRRLVECELEDAASRPKGAAAASTLGGNQGKNNVVSHFVRDILQDNANLQMGIVELREMLANSNEEVETLREQMLLHQPALTPNQHSIAQDPLRSQLAMSAATTSKPELHVYHHYQPAGRLVREKSQGLRRPRKTRNFASSELLSPRAGSRTPRSSSSRGTTRSPGANAELKPSRTSAPSQASSFPRWSMQSSQTQRSMAPSTVPSSPQSTHENPSIFDSLDNTADFSRPTSPESISVGSPRFTCRHRTALDTPVTSLTRSVYGERKHVVPKRNVLQPPDEKTAGGPDTSLASTAIVEETENGLAINFSEANQGSDSDKHQVYSQRIPTRPQLHRSTSHESILSIPTSSYRPPPSHLFNPVIMPSRAVLTPTPATATALPASHSLRLSSSTYNRSLLSNLRGPPSSMPPTHLAPRNVPPPSSEKDPKQQLQQQQTLGKRVGGWVWGKWGVAPMASTGDLRDHAKPDMGIMRATGVNQKGSIGGLTSTEEKKNNKKDRAEVQVGVIDEGLLKESLGEG